jgi:phosphodiesterase/alkaline phosphatase D-like protein
MSMRTAVIGLVLCMPMVASAAPTPAQLCAAGVSSAARKYFDNRFKIVAGCEDQQAAGVAGLTCDPDTDFSITPKLASARSTLSRRIEGSCPGGIIASVDLGLACDGLGTVNDVVDCIVEDAHGAISDELIETTYDGVGVISNPVVRLCQRTIGKAARKAAGQRQRAREKCNNKELRGELYPCPDAKATKVLGKATGRLTTLVEKRCPDSVVTDAEIEFGLPCDAFELVTFDRDGNTNDNLIPVSVRFSRCLADSVARAADAASDIVFPLPDAAPFSYGVAAGDADDTSFVAWTRTDGPGAVSLEVSLDPLFAAGVTTVGPLTPDTGGDNTVKTIVTGLLSGSQYYYRFLQGGDASRTGRIRTAPPAGTTPPFAFTFAFSGDSNAAFKPFTVLEGIRGDDPDLWLYVGDTIYADDERSGSGLAEDLAEYHVKYKENRDDHALRAVLASVGTVAMYDDHETVNDWYGGSFDGVSGSSVWGSMIPDGNAAFRDYMPMREDVGDPEQIYRSVKWGDVAEFFLIDPRRYRSPQAYVTEPACLSGMDPAVLPPAGACQNEIADPGRTYLGTAQKAWLKSALLASTATWKFIMNGPLVSQLIFIPYDRWEGYSAERTEMLEFIQNPDGNVMTDDHIENVVVLSTDIHAAIYNTAVPNPGPAGGSIPEIVAGAIGMDPIYRELPPSILALVSSLPSIFPTVEYYDIDRFNYAHFTVDHSAAEVTFRDGAGTVLKTFTLAAE